MSATALKHPKTPIAARKRNADAMTRIDARISRRLKDKIEQAAHLRDQTVTNFLTAALDEAASKVILEDSTLRLHMDDQKHLAEVLLSGKPFPPVSEMSTLRRYAAGYAKTVERK